MQTGNMIYHMNILTGVERIIFIFV